MGYNKFYLNSHKETNSKIEFSNVASISIPLIYNDDNYTQIDISFECDTLNQSYWIRFNSNSGANYDYSGQTSGGTVGSTVNQAQCMVSQQGGGTNRGQFSIRLQNFYDSSQDIFFHSAGLVQVAASLALSDQRFSGVGRIGADITSMQFFGTAGNIYGTIKVKEYND